jgi:hypothetical protein
MFLPLSTCLLPVRPKLPFAFGLPGDGEAGYGVTASPLAGDGEPGYRATASRTCAPGGRPSRCAASPALTASETSPAESV